MTVLSVKKNAPASTAVAIFPDGLGDDVGDALGVVVTLGKGEGGTGEGGTGEGLEVGVGLTVLEAVVLAEVEAFSVRLAGATLL